MKKNPSFTYKVILKWGEKCRKMAKFLQKRQFCVCKEGPKNAGPECFFDVIIVIFFRYLDLKCRYRLDLGANSACFDGFCGEFVPGWVYIIVEGMSLIIFP